MPEIKKAKTKTMKKTVPKVIKATKKAVKPKAAAKSVSKAKVKTRPQKLAPPKRKITAAKKKSVVVEEILRQEIKVEKIVLPKAAPVVTAAPAQEVAPLKIIPGDKEVI